MTIIKKLPLSEYSLDQREKSAQESQGGLKTRTSEAVSVNRRYALGFISCSYTLNMEHVCRHKKSIEDRVCCTLEMNIVRFMGLFLVGVLSSMPMNIVRFMGSFLVGVLSRCQ